mmetsp:Transcript_20901/g.23638  ORF Transcript_20901/g.23638 Transcript_20901/m.23638 type:complete len:142 (-) Transcript_20901:157-582(-)
MGRGVFSLVWEFHLISLKAQSSVVLPLMLERNSKYFPLLSPSLLVQQKKCCTRLDTIEGFSFFTHIYFLLTRELRLYNPMYINYFGRKDRWLPILQKSSFFLCEKHILAFTFLDSFLIRRKKTSVSKSSSQSPNLGDPFDR